MSGVSRKPLRVVRHNMKCPTPSHALQGLLAVIPVAAVVVILGLAYDLEQARAESFSLSIIVQPGDVIDGKTVDGIDSSSPSLNDNGDVAFIGGFRDSTGSRAGIATQNTLLVEEGLIDGKVVGGFGPGTNRKWLNNSGDVVFRGGFGGGAGIFNQNTLLTQTGQTIDVRILQSLGTPTINDNGDVAFVGGTGFSGIFSPSSLLVEVGQTIGGKTLTIVGSPSAGSQTLVVLYSPPHPPCLGVPFP